METTMTRPAFAFFKAFLRAKMPLTMRGLWMLHVAGMLALLPREVRVQYEAPRWVPTGRATRTAIRIMLRVMNVLYPMFPAIRSGRRRLDELERARGRSGSALHPAS